MAPEDAVRAMKLLTAALRENTAASIETTRQLTIFNQIMAQIGQKSGNAGMVKALLEAAGIAAARRVGRFA